MPEWHIRRVSDEDAGALEEVRSLFREYHEWLGEVMCSVRLPEEIASLPGPYASPRGRLFVAHDARDSTLGCVGIRPHDDESAEIKRLYVRPRGRGSGLGRALAETAIAAARELGYGQVLITTLPESMQVAAAMYTRMGFEEVAPFADHRHAGDGVRMLYLAKRL